MCMLHVPMLTPPLLSSLLRLSFVTGKQNNPLKKFMEASLGKVAVGRGEAENLQQFLKNDRMVLRFFCTWDDTKRLYGDKNAFVINYFLADDTVEVREVPVLNSGRDKFPMLLGKQKVNKRRPTLPPSLPLLGNNTAGMLTCATAALRPVSLPALHLTVAQGLEEGLR